MDNVKDIIKNLVKDSEEIYSQPCTVVSVDRSSRTIEAQPINGDAKLFDVRLQSRESGEMGLVIFPKIDSEVIVTFLSNTNAFVSRTQDIEDVVLKIDDFELTIDKENFNKSVKNISIKSDDLQHETKKAKFTTETVFEVVSSADAKIKALAVNIEASTVDVAGVTSITGATTITGATAISGALTVSGAVAMGGGTNGGIPKGAAVSSELNKLVTEVNKIVKALKDWSPVREDGGAALKALTSGIEELEPVVQASISNPNATH